MGNWVGGIFLCFQGDLPLSLSRQSFCGWFNLWSILLGKGSTARHFPFWWASVQLSSWCITLRSWCSCYLILGRWSGLWPLKLSQFHPLHSHPETEKSTFNLLKINFLKINSSNGQSETDLGASKWILSCQIFSVIPQSPPCWTGMARREEGVTGSGSSP